MAFRENTLLVGTNTGDIRSVTVDNWKEVTTVDIVTLAWTGSEIHSLSFSPLQPEKFICASADGIIRTYTNPEGKNLIGLDSEFNIFSNPHGIEAEEESEEDAVDPYEHIVSTFNLRQKHAPLNSLLGTKTLFCVLQMLSNMFSLWRMESLPGSLFPSSQLHLTLTWLEMDNG